MSSKTSKKRPAQNGSKTKNLDEKKSYGNGNNGTSKSARARGRPGPSPGTMSSRYDSSLGLLTRKFTHLIQVRFYIFANGLNPKRIVSYLKRNMKWLFSQHLNKRRVRSAVQLI